MMQRFFKIVYWSSILLLCFWIITTILGALLPIEFTNKDNESIYKSMRFLGLPIALMLTLTGTIKRIDSLLEMAATLFLTICVTAFTVFIMITTMLADMCGWTTKHLIFENKENPSIKIVQRSYGCGASDSSPATLDVFQVSACTPMLIWVTKIDTNQINKEQWTRVDKECF